MIHTCAIKMSKKSCEILNLFQNCILLTYIYKHRKKYDWIKHKQFKFNCTNTKNNLISVKRMYNLWRGVNDKKPHFGNN